MSTYTPKPNTGTLFKNTKKTSEKHPDMDGTILIGDKQMRIAAWTKQGKSGRFLSLVISEIEFNRNTQTTPQPVTPPDGGDNLPF
jgi:hypothetical protein